MPTCYLHIGPAKTGQTYLHHFIAANNDIFSQYGVYIPHFSGVSAKFHHNLGHSILKSDRYLSDYGNFSDLECQLKNRDSHVLIISGTFTRAFQSAEGSKMILDFFKRLGFKVHVTAFIRPQQSHLNSQYVQMVKLFRSIGTFDQFVERNIHNQSHENIFSQLVKEANHNPDLKFSAIPYANGILSEGIENHLLNAVLGTFDRSDFCNVERVNQNSGKKTVATFCTLTQKFSENSALRISFSELDLKNMTNRVLETAAEIGWAQDRYSGMDHHLARSIHKYFADRNDEFANAVWGNKWQDNFSKEELFDFRRNVFEVDEATMEEKEEFYNFIDDLLNFGHK